MIFQWAHDLKVKGDIQNFPKEGSKIVETVLQSTGLEYI